MKKPGFIQYLVICINDDGKPDGIGDWPKKNKIYELEEALPNAAMDGSLSFSIKGLNPQGKWDGYRSDRFAPYMTINLN